MIRVWAPKAVVMEIEAQGKRHSMQKGNEGWWSVNLSIPSGTDYAFYVNGEGPFPDPRSPWQPDGVHGPSRVVDHKAFLWADQRWQAPPLESAIIYELHIGAFTPEGTFESAIDRLDHLVQLGITHVEIMPIAQFSGQRGWGYDGVTLYAPYNCYGGPEGLKRLVNSCHEKGLAVILDVVYNHLGPTGNYIEKYGEYLTEKYKTVWGKSINTDTPGSDSSRRFFIENALMWLRDYHIDGLRLDAADNIFDSSAIHILEQLASEVHALQAQLGRHLFVTAEANNNDPRYVRPPELGGYGIDAHWIDDFHHAVRATVAGEQSGYYADYEPYTDLARSLREAYAYSNRYTPFFGRHRGRSADPVSGHQFIAFIQNHDQVGNRAKGDRLSQQVSIGKQKIGATILLTSPYIPLIFMGEEWGASTPFQYFMDADEEELAEAVRKGRCNEFAAFGWDPKQIPDPTSEKTFLRSKLKWDEIKKKPHVEILDWYRHLIRLRKEVPVLRNGRRDQVKVQYDAKNQWMIIDRLPVVIALNLSEKDQRLTMTFRKSAGIMLASAKGIELYPDGVLLPPESVVILFNPDA